MKTLIMRIIMVISLLVVVFLVSCTKEQPQEVSVDTSSSKEEKTDNPYGKKKSELNPLTVKQLNNPNYQNIILPEDLEKRIKRNEPLYVYIYSASCGYCEKATPKILKEAKNLGIKVYQLNLLEYEKGWEQYQIEGTPTLAFFQNGKELYRIVGDQEQDIYKKWLMTIETKVKK